MAELLRGVVAAELRRVDALPLHLGLLLFHVIVRTVRHLLEVVALASADHLRAAHARTRGVNVLLLPDGIWSRVAHILRTLALPVQQVHLGALPEAYLWQILCRLRAVATR